ncbi:alpha/beta fold hydrolase [Amnibacterium flavum]|uniref:Alpha/beta hydrolase n=1 Tax=Amnibacterium flavum TaxID=2173173 RepID=A0A2V1HPH7_9MICO|nr:alpha/beta hydrolase [Amnibacterium flavum]PVZ94448.1 alpha/beta hydrolase [Amnibacterium flavum]
MKQVVSPYESVLDQAVGRPRSTTVLGSRTAYWEYGAESPERSLVLVHGFRGDHHGLEAIAAHVAALDPGLRVIVPDLPGFGASEPLREAEHDIHGYAAWLRLFTDAVDANGSPVLGHSFGTIVVSAALASGLAAPRAVLVNPIAAPALSGPNAIGTRLAIFYYWLGSRLPEKLGFWVLRWRVVTRGMSVFMAKTRDPALRRWIHNQHDLYFGAFANRRVVLDAFRASVSHDVSEYARGIGIPVRLIVAEKDEITPLSAQRTLVSLFPNASMHVEMNVGHLIHYERPAETAREIETFIGSAES